MSGSLSQRTFSAAYWGTAGTAVRLVMQLGAQVLMARILGPDHYGLFAIGMIVTSLGHLFSDAGMAYGLIQRRSVSALDIRYVFTWQLGLGVLVTAAIVASAGSIAQVFAKPQAQEVIAALASICLIGALTAPSLSLLKRDLNQRQITVSQVTSYAVGYLLVGIPMALGGAGVWALVAASIVHPMMYLALLYNATRHPLRPVLSHPQARKMSQMGLMLQLANLANWVTINADRAFVGRSFSSSAMGLYSTSYGILYTPAAALLDAVQPVFFSASAKIQDQQHTMAMSYRALMAAICLYLLPIFAITAAVAETFIVALYGPQWHEATPFVLPLALAMPFFFASGLSTPLLWTSGQGAKDLAVQGPLALLWAASCWWAAHHSVVAVAWTVLGLCVLRAVVFMSLAARAISVTLPQLWGSVKGGLLATLVTTGVVALIDRGVGAMHPLPRLFLDALAGGVTLILLLNLAPQLISAELLELNRRATSHLPQSVRRTLSFLHQQTVDVRP